MMGKDDNVTVMGYFGVRGQTPEQQFFCLRVRIRLINLGSNEGLTKQVKSIMSELIPQEENAIFVLKSLAVRTTEQTIFAMKNSIIVRLFSLKAPKQ